MTLQEAMRLREGDELMMQDSNGHQMFGWVAAVDRQYKNVTLMWRLPCGVAKLSLILDEIDATYRWPKIAVLGQ